MYTFYPTVPHTHVAQNPPRRVQWLGTITQADVAKMLPSQQKWLPILLQKVADGGIHLSQDGSSIMPGTTPDNNSVVLVLDPNAYAPPLDVPGVTAQYAKMDQIATGLGFQGTNGVYAFPAAAPPSGTTPTTGGGGDTKDNTWLWIGAAALLAAGVAVLFARPKTTEAPALTA
jgi:hypothetical protein